MKMKVRTDPESIRPVPAAGTGQNAATVIAVDRAGNATVREDQGQAGDGAPRRTGRDA
jgi:hypothetical protein